MWGVFSRLYRLETFVLAWLMVLLVSAAHEFAHGVTCKHFGGEVHEIGFMLLYFQPALYCNVSDAWLFPEKSKRLWVTFAGPYFELFLWSLATMLWRLTEEDTLINYVGFIVMTSSGVKTLFNFNPLIKLDGYYLLSDYLGMPNLRRKSFRFVGDGIKRLFGAVAQNPVEVSARERRAYLAYGLMGSVGSFSALGLAFAALGRYLVDQNQPMAFVFFAGFLGAKFRRRIRNLFGKPSSKSTSSSDLEDEDDSFDSDDSNTSAPERAVADAKAQPKRGNKKPLRFKKTLIAVVLAAVAVPILFLGKSELKIRGLFNVLPIHNADIRAEVEAIVEEINVDEGDVVQAGDVIARLSDRDVRADLRKTEADIDQRRAKLKMVEAVPTDQEVETAQA